MAAKTTPVLEALFEAAEEVTRGRRAALKDFRLIDPPGGDRAGPVLPSL
jgi:hypothetical protein